MRENERDVLDKFYKLVQLYLERNITAQAFVDEYLVLWKQYRDSEEAYLLNTKGNSSIDRIFTATESYWGSDAKEDDPFQLNDDELYREVSEIMKDLSNLKAKYE